MITLMFILLFGGLLAGLPVFATLAVASLSPYFVTGEARTLLTLAQRLFSGIARYNLLAVPMFVLAGNLMTATGIMDRLLGVANVIIGRVRGGLAQVNIVASMLFAGISGSAIADTSALGSILIPAMEKEGYDKGFAGAVTAASAIVGPIIPPSNVMIIYGATFGLPISTMFAAGMFPGIFVGLALMAVTAVISVRQQHPKGTPIGLKDSVITMWKGLVPLGMPIIILGGIFGGVFTATEASAVAVLYAFVIGGFVYRTLTLKKLYKIFFDTIKTSAGTVLIVGFSQNFAWVLARYQIPQMVLERVVALTQSPVALLLLVNAFLFVVGLFIGRTVAMLILGPMLIPILIGVGLHPLHVAMVIIFALGVGHLTPPFGVLLFTAAYAGDVKIEAILKQVPIYVLTLLVINMIVTFIPDFVMFFPRMLGML